MFQQHFERMFSRSCGYFWSYFVVVVRKFTQKKDTYLAFGPFRNFGFVLVEQFSTTRQAGVFIDLSESRFMMNKYVV